MSLINFFFLRKYFPGCPDNWVISYYFWGRRTTQKREIQEAFVFLKRNHKRFSRLESGVKIEDLSEEQEKGQMMGGHAKEKRDPGKGRTGLVVLSSLTKDLPFPVCATKVHKRWGWGNWLGKEGFQLYICMSLQYWIIMISARLNDRVEDDFLYKPAKLSLLHIRITTILWLHWCGTDV